MENKIIVVVPSRSAGVGREHNVERFIQHWMYFSEGMSDLCISLDDDDEHYYQRYKGVMYTVNTNERLVPKLNRAATYFKDKYRFIAFFGDDHVIQTNWENKMVNYMNKEKVSITYGNDLLQGSRLPTAVCMTTNIIERLGYMIYPSLLHMYADNFWKDLGDATKCLKYFNDIIWEHKHPDIKKAVRDTQYNYAAATVSHDASVYQSYLNSNLFIDDVTKIMSLKNQLMLL